MSPQTLSSHGALCRLQEVKDLRRKDTQRCAFVSQAQEGRNNSPSGLQDNVRIYHSPMLALPCLPRIKHQTIPFVYLSALDLITIQKSLMTEGAIRSNQVKFERKKRGSAAFLSNPVKSFRKTARAVLTTRICATHCCAPTTQRTFDATADTPHCPVGSGARTGLPTSTCAPFAAGTPNYPVGRGVRTGLPTSGCAPHAVAQPRHLENLPSSCRVSIFTSTTVTQDLAIRSCRPPPTLSFNRFPYNASLHPVISSPPRTSLTRPHQQCQPKAASKAREISIKDKTTRKPSRLPKTTTPSTSSAPPIQWPHPTPWLASWS